MKNRGFSLIELIIFIVVLGIAVAIITTFNTPLIGSHYIDEGTQALELAQQRMEIIISNPAIRSPIANLSKLVDLCPTYSDVCNISSVPGYIVNASISNDCSAETEFVSFNGQPVFATTTDCRAVRVYVYYSKNGNQVVFLSRGITNHT